MFAKNLEILLDRLFQKSDVSSDLPKEFADRFDALRRSGRLPRGRENQAKPLTDSEIASAILGMACSTPSWAGQAAVILSGLRPVGGTDASFFGAETLQKAIEHILCEPNSRRNVIQLRVSVAEGGINSHGYATLSYEIKGVMHRAFFVPKEAISLLQPGAERDFNAEQRYSPASKETVFSSAFFDRITLEVERAKAFPALPEGDGSEYDAEEAQQERYRKLGVRPNSLFLNIGVDNQVTWPKHETLVKFDRYHFVLMPKTRDHVQSVHVDLTANALTDREAMTMINRFLSVMTWCDDQFAIAPRYGG